MDFIITVTDQDLRMRTPSWFLNELPKIQNEMKVAANLLYDNSRLEYSLRGELFSLHFSQVSGTKESMNYAMHKRMPGFKVVSHSGRDDRICLFNVYKWHMWDHAGSVSLADGLSFVCDPDEPLPPRVQDGIYIVAKNYIDGIVQCSHCNKTIKRDEIAGSYFAGVYCWECWDREYRVRESKETYN